MSETEVAEPARSGSRTERSLVILCLGICLVAIAGWVRGYCAIDRITYISGGDFFGTANGPNLVWIGYGQISGAAATDGWHFQFIPMQVVLQHSPVKWTWMNYFKGSFDTFKWGNVPVTGGRAGDYQMVLQIPQLLIAVIAFLFPLASGILRGRRFFRRRHRVATGMCAQCGYDLRGHAGATCSRCGIPIPGRGVPAAAPR